MFNEILKMADQLEMSTGQNVFRQTVNFFGKPIPLKTSFSFNPVQQINTGNSKTVTVNSTWTPYNTSMVNPTD